MNSAVEFIYYLAAPIGVISIFWFAQRPPPKWSWFLLTPLCLLFGAEGVRLSRPPHWFYDFFAAYYPAGQAVLRHDPQSLRALTGQGVAGFVNMPVVAYLFAPFATLGPSAAAAVFTLLGVGVTIAAWGLLVRLADLQTPERWGLAFLFIANGPLLSGITLGNTSCFILYALAASLLLVRAERSAIASVVLALAAVIKPPLLLFGVFFLLRRDFRGVLGFGITYAAVTLASLVLFGLSDNLHWFDTCILQFGHTWVVAVNVQSISAFLFRLNADSAVLFEWKAHTPTSQQRLLADILSGAVLFLGALASMRRPGAAVPSVAEARTRLDLQYLLTICLSLVASPLTWSHYYVWLLVPVAFFLKLRPDLSRPERWIGWTAIALVTPMAVWSNIPNAGLMNLYSTVFVSHFLFGGLLWFGLIAWWLSRRGGLLSVQQRSDAQGEVVRV